MKLASLLLCIFVLLVSATSTFGQETLKALQEIRDSKPTLPNNTPRLFISGSHSIRATVIDITDSHVQLRPEAGGKPISVARNVLSEYDTEFLERNFTDYVNKRAEWHSKVVEATEKHKEYLEIVRQEAARKAADEKLRLAEEAAEAQRKAEVAKRRADEERKELEAVAQFLANMQADISRVTNTGILTYQPLMQETSVSPVIIVSEGSVSLAMRIMFRNDDWLFIKKATLVRGRQRVALEIPALDRKTEILDGGIAEWATFAMADDLLKIFDVDPRVPFLVRLDGDQYYHEFDVSEENRAIMNAVMQLYKFLSRMERNERAALFLSLTN